MTDKRLPESFYCPITMSIMIDPVVDPEGISYERSAIEEWLKTHATSPVTRSILTASDLVSNRALKDVIEQKCKELDIDLRSSKEKKPINLEESSTSKQSSTTPTPTSNTFSLSVAARPTSIKDEYDVLVSIKPPVGTTRSPLDICCVVDVSGSMGEEATLQNDQGKKEAHGLSLLDVVKHAVKTIVAALGPQDRLSIVKYSSDAEVVVPLTHMNEQEKKKILKQVEVLHTEGSTNLWDGLHKGLEMLRTNSQPDKLTALMLLTDGLPNISPPRGEIAMLQKYKDQNKQLSCTISTFGFGYSINSELLRNISIEGHGMYVFIPDASFVGTAFVNTLSNLLVTAAKNVLLSFEPLSEAKILPNGLIGGHSSQITNWGALYNLCSLELDQTKDVVVKMHIPNSMNNQPYLQVTLKCEGRNNVNIPDVSVEGKDRNGNVEVLVQKFRLQFVDTVRSAMDIVANNPDGAKQLIKNLIKEIQDSGCTDSRISTLLEDLKGQVTEAFSKMDWYRKWGRHYLPSLMRAHLLQQCNNFKDPGIQHYGGSLFISIRDVIDDLFCKLPPPKPSVKSTSSYSVAPVGSMNVYYNRSAPCFDGSCKVLMANGTYKRVDNVKKGDFIMSINNLPAQVVCVIKTLCYQSKTQLVELKGGLLVTPYHPVRIENKWYFPCQLGTVMERPCSSVYSFILNEQHIMMINDIQCVTLGHDFKDDVIVAHPYFGSKLVIEDLQKMPGWNEGQVEFNSGCMIRDSKTGLVNGFSSESMLFTGA